MATCRLCNKSGWFLRTTDDGLCQPCDELRNLDTEQYGRIVGESIKLIEKSRVLKTRLGRIDDAIRACQELLKYDHRKIKTLVTWPSEAIEELERVRRKIVLKEIDDQLVKARTKSQNATTSASKISPYNKIIDTIGSFYQVLDDVSELERIEQETRVEMDEVQLAAELERAERAEFKGQKKKALDAYLDALFLIRKDSIDDAHQVSEIRHIEAKVRDLGGKIPGE